MNQKHIVIVLSIIFFTVSTPVFAKKGNGHQGCDGGGSRGGGGGSMQAMDLPQGKWWKMPKVVESLNLTETEQKKLDELFFNFRSSKIDLRSKMMKEKLKIEPILENSTLNRGDCMAQFKKILAAQNEMSRHKFNFLLDVRELLGADRFQRLKSSFKKNMRKKKMKGKDM